MTRNSRRMTLSPMIRRHALGLVQADPQSEKPIENSSESL
jgi:hypothetical protein